MTRSTLTHTQKKKKILTLLPHPFLDFRITKSCSVITLHFMVITDPILFLGCPPNPPHFMGVHQTLDICWVMHTGPPPGGGHISWVLTRPSWSAHLWMPTRMLTFVSRSHLPSWEDGSGCAPGRHLLRPYLAHLATAAPHCDLAHHCLVAVALGRTGLLSHHSTHLLPDSHTVITSVNRLTLTTHSRH